MARCTGCGNELAANSRFCSICGTPTAPAATQPGTGAPRPPTHPTQMPPPASGASLRPPTAPSPTMMPNAGYGAPGGGGDYDDGSGKKKIYMAAGIGGVLLLIALALFLKASGILGAKPTETPRTAVLNAPAAQAVPAPVMNAPPVAAPKVSAPVLQPPTAQGNPMPEDVVAYLRWLKQFETARRNLKAHGDADFMMILTKVGVGGAALTDLFKEPDQQKDNPSILAPEDYNTINKNIQEWNMATGLFQQKMPPNACAPLAASYNNMLATTTKEMVSLRGVLDDIQRMSQGDKSVNIQSIMGTLTAQNNSKGMSRAADSTFGSADAALNQLRDRYTSMPEDIDKAHFDIEDQSQVSVPGVSIPGAGM